MARSIEVGDASGISLVLPAFNEQECIHQAVKEAVEALSTLGMPFEVVVVNDGSTDATAPMVAAMAANDQRVRLIDLPQNQGYGNALRQGFLASRMPLVAFTDSDCQFHLEDLRLLIDQIPQSPVVVGCRQDRKDPWRRKFLSRGFNLLADSLVGTGVRDVDCALKVFRRADLLKILPETGGFLVNTEMVVRARSMGLDVREVPVRHRPRAGGHSKVRLTEVPKVFLALARFWFTRVAFGHTGHSGDGTPARMGKAEFLGLIGLAVLAVAMFLGNVRAPLLEPTEARYAEIPRQMLIHGSWLVPVLDGQPYLDKPPLFYWLVMGAYQMGGVSDRVARWVPGLAGVLTVLVAWGWMRLRTGPRAAFLSAFLLVTCARFVHYERMLAMDSVLCLLVLAALACGDLACHSGGFRRSWWVAGALTLGLALLTKGFVAIPVVLGPLAMWWVLDQGVGRPGWKDAVLGAFLALLPLMAWMVPMAARLDGFLEYFVWRHHVVRFLEPFDHAGPVWYYLPGLLFGLGPWLVLLPGLVGRVLGRSALRAGGGQPVLGLVLTALAFNLAFFSLAGCKRPVYSMAFVPFAAIALGLHLDLALPAGWRKLFSLPTISAKSAFVLVGAIWIGLGCGAGYKGWIDAESAYGCVALGSSLLAVLGVWHWAGRGVAWSAPLAACAVLGVFTCWEVLPGYHEGFSLRGHLRQAMKPRWGADLLAKASVKAETELVCFPHRWDSAGFYLPNAKITVFGPGDQAAMENHLRQNPDALLLMKPGRALNQFLARFPTRSPKIENSMGAVAVTRLEERGLTRNSFKTE